MSFGLSGLSIIVIDDNRQMRTIIGTVLSAAGVRRLHYAPDGAEALHLMKHTSIDVAYVDHEMPRMNGIEFIGAVRAMRGPEQFLPIIMLTGHSDVRSLATARDVGMTEFLVKPVTAKAILLRLNAVIMTPRQFVRSSTYFGPDRRRVRDPEYRGPRRREMDARASIEI